MASHPPGRCCAVGVKHSGTPTGKKVTIAGKIEGYLAAAPADSSPAVHHGVGLLLLPDIIGIWQNSKLMADQFAANGYTTLLVDLFNGDARSLNLPAGFDPAAWLQKGSTGDNPHTPSAVDPIVIDAIAYMRSELGCKKIGAMGYCFGAKYVARHYKSGIDVGYMAHPSYVDEDELLSITGPLSIAAAEIDTIFTVEKRHKSEVLLAQVGKPWQINLFSTVSHGFAVRGDLNKPMERFAKEQAFLQAITWFDEYLL